MKCASGCAGLYEVWDSENFARGPDDVNVQFGVDGKAEEALKICLNLEATQFALILICAIQAHPDMWDLLTEACLHGASREEAIAVFNEYVEAGLANPKSREAQPAKVFGGGGAWLADQSLGVFDQSISTLVEDRGLATKSQANFPQRNGDFNRDTFFPNARNPAIQSKYAPGPLKQDFSAQTNLQSELDRQRGASPIDMNVPFSSRNAYASYTAQRQMAQVEQIPYDSRGNQNQVEQNGQIPYDSRGNPNLRDPRKPVANKNEFIPVTDDLSPPVLAISDRPKAADAHIDMRRLDKSNRMPENDKYLSRTKTRSNQVEAHKSSRKVQESEPVNDPVPLPQEEEDPAQEAKEDAPEENDGPPPLPPRPERIHRPVNPNLKHEPIIQFGAPMYICNEEEGEVIVEIFRHGPSTQQCTVAYKTKDFTAKAGQRYKAVQGIIKFEPGEFQKEVKVPVITNDSFDATLEFEMLLKNPQNAQVGKYLYRTTIKVADDDAFPSNRFAAEVTAGGQKLHDVPKALLLLEYFKMNYQNPIVKRGTRKMFLVEQMHNVYLLWRLNIMRYLIDEILAEPKEGEEAPTIEEQTPKLMWCCFVIVVPFCLLHYLDVKKLGWRVGGTSRKLIQANLLRKFLNYDIEARNNLEVSDLVMAMTRDTEKLIAKGYSRFVLMVANLGRVYLIFMQQVALPFAYGTRPDPIVVLTLVTFPLFTYMFLKLRNRKTEDTLQAESLAQNKLVAYVQSAIGNYRLLADYNRQSACVVDYETRIANLNTMVIVAGQVTTNNKYFAPWLATMVTGLYILWGGYNVLTGEIQLGAFLMNLEIFKVIGTTFADIYGMILDMQSVFPALTHICRFMNLPIDVHQRMNLGRQRNEFAHKSLLELYSAARKKKTQDSSMNGFAIDLIPISVDHVTYTFPVHLVVGSAVEQGTTDLSSGAFQIKQGTLTGLVSKRGGGQTSMLKVLGGVLLPERGLNIPSHLRVLHISEAPMFFAGTLTENMIFGLPTHLENNKKVVEAENQGDGSVEHIVAICTKLKVSEKIIARIQMENEPTFTQEPETSIAWNEILSQTQRALLNLARALIANPEVLCIHKPTRSFDPNSAEFTNTLRVLRTFVDDKGLEQEPSEWDYRRPRTCIITAGQAFNRNHFDSILLVQGTEGVKEIIDDPEEMQHFEHTLAVKEVNMVRNSVLT